MSIQSWLSLDCLHWLKPGRQHQAGRGRWNAIQLESTSRELLPPARGWRVREQPQGLESRKCKTWAHLNASKHAQIKNDSKNDQEWPKSSGGSQTLSDKDEEKMDNAERTSIIGSLYWACWANKSASKIKGFLGFLFYAQVHEINRSQLCFSRSWRSSKRRWSQWEWPSIRIVDICKVKTMINQLKLTSFHLCSERA